MIDPATAEALIRYLKRVVPHGPTEQDELHDLLRMLAHIVKANGP
jgi:hypothetical protein